jgi:hypothetical protein
MVNGLLDEAAKIYPAKLKKDQVFEFFCADNILTNYDVSHAEIEAGIIDGKGDGGIDAIYLFVNRRLVAADFNFKTVSAPVDIELVVIQSKNVESFAETPVDRLLSCFSMALGGQASEGSFKKTFKPEVVAAFAAFRNAIGKLATKFPEIAIRAFYCAKANKPPANIEGKREAVESLLKSHYPNSRVEILGAAQLYELAKQQKDLDKLLPTTAAPLFSGEKAMVALCGLEVFAKFISDDTGILINRIFEANVRDYQGEVEVNKEISETLTQSKTPDFWWMNNGVTIVADKARWVSPNISIKNPLIVNGLQTSFELHRNVASLANDSRNVLVRIIEVTDPTERERVIRATNRQTNIKHSSFRASEPVHIQIEDYLKTLGIYYDRRKNRYKREGKPADRILSIDRLAQVVLSVLLEEPHTARARPTSAIKRDVDYKKIFPAAPNAFPLAFYGVLAELNLKVEEHFRTLRGIIDQSLLNNMRFHVLMALAWTLNKNATLPAARIGQLKPNKVTAQMLNKVSSWVFDEFKTYGALDKNSKDSKFTSRLRATWTPPATG